MSQRVKDGFRLLVAARKVLGLGQVRRSIVVREAAQFLGVRIPTGRPSGYALLRRLLSGQPKQATRPRVAYSKEASDAFLASAEWRRLRMRVIKKRGARCECCGASPRDGVTVINVDHIKPRRDFPELSLEESNLQVLCGACNHGKGNWDQTDWRPERQALQEPMSAEDACRIANKYLH